MITLTQLEYIVAVERYGNFKRAAKSCFVTQPTLSMQIQKLEDHLGVILFDRSKQPVTPTPLGQKVLDQSRVVLSQANLITELINQAKDRIEGDLRLAVIPTLAPYLLPLFVNEFSREFPLVRLFVEESKTDEIIAALQRNQLDIGLLVTPLDEPNLVEHPVFQEPFYVYTAAKSRLAEKNHIKESDLKNYEMLLLTEGHCMREQMLKVCRLKDHQEPRNTRLQFESGSIETLCHLVERSEGYTIIPHLAKAWLQQRPGVSIPFADPAPSREVSLVVHRSFVRNSLLQALLQCMRAQLPRELQDPEKKLKTIPIH